MERSEDPYHVVFGSAYVVAQIAALSNLFFCFKGDDSYYISVGCFDDDSDFELVGEIYVDVQPPGYRFAEGIERMTGDDFIARYGISGEGD